MITNKKNNKGFTLIELMIAIAIGSIVIAGTVMLFHRQIMANNTQRLIVSMQQNVRAAVSFMERDIRMAASDPTGEARLNPDFPPPEIQT
ncbi:MAG: prepilin-type N-terminal cleavage/methylation domain-containing protein, partial [Desulfobacterales bacterium]